MKNLVYTVFAALMLLASSNVLAQSNCFESKILGLRSDSGPFEEDEEDDDEEDDEEEDEEEDVEA
jgi:hypothetical protein